MGQGKSQGKGAPTPRATQQGRVALGGKILLYRIMEEGNERKHVGWSLRREQMSCQTQDSGQEAFPRDEDLGWSVLFETKENHWSC